MTEGRDWHTEDSFWQALEPFMFNEERWTGTVHEVDLLLELVDLDPEAYVCDIGCGPGRFSLELSRRGFQVIGVDRTEFYLESGRMRAAKENLDLNFMKADMRSFVRPNAFDGVISMYTTMGYFEDPAENLQVLKNIYRSLREKGVLLIELMGKEVLARIFVDRGWDQVGNVFFLQERKVNKDWSWMENRWILLDGQKRIEYQVNHWIYSAVELREMLQDVGFTGIQIYGNLAGGQYDQTADRLIAVAYKG